MTKKIEKIFEENWDDIKSDLKSLWSKLTHKDLKAIDGSYDQFMEKIEEVYGTTRDKIEVELQELFDSCELTESKNKSSHKSRSTIGMIENCVQEYLQSMEENIIQYIKNNPVKILGLAAIASYSLSKLMSTSSK